ncbi:MAG: hypothetical protein JWP43_3405 [Ramlibacter sp.]|nr:hypothetical protein [Ramlibacter sp.]
MGALSKLAFAGACLTVVALEGLAVAGWQGWRPAPSAAASPANEVPLAVAALAPALSDAPAAPAPLAAVPQPREQYYAELRHRIHWVPTRMGDETLATPDAPSRMLLVKSAAQQAGLEDVGLGFKDVYGLISAETSWIPRTGASKDGTPNLGIAQFEPATARSLGVRNPDDPVESVHIAALHMKAAALWSQERIAGLKLDAAERAQRLREGVSIYYNLSSRGRSAWNGSNTRKLPRETQLHIYNSRLGAREADQLEAGLRPSDERSRETTAMMLTASNSLR